jgi:V/A-type H+-transporting ATPase subunit K
MESAKKSFKKKIALSLMFLFIFFAVFSLFTVERTYAQDQSPAAAAQPTAGHDQAEVAKFGLVAAAIAFGFGAIGAGVAIGNVGAAAMGAIGERPEIASQALIFIALAEGLVVFGFITALMILGKI